MREPEHSKIVHLIGGLLVAMAALAGRPALAHIVDGSAAGGVIAILGVSVPGVEIGIALSAIVLGGMIALAARPPLVGAALIVAAFAIFHGHAHGAELPPGTDAVAFSVGFVMATGLLHLTGIAFGLLTRWPTGRIGVRV